MKIGVLLVFLVILTDVNCRRNYWRKKIHGSFNKYSKHHKKSIEKIQHHAPGHISKPEAKLQGHLNHHKNRFHVNEHELSLQHLGHHYNQQLVLPRPASTKQPDTTPMNVKGNHHHRKNGHKAHLKKRKQMKKTARPKPLDLPKFKKHGKKTGRAKKYRKYSKYMRKYGKKHNKHH